MDKFTRKQSNKQVFVVSKVRLTGSKPLVWVMGSENAVYQWMNDQGLDLNRYNIVVGMPNSENYDLLGVEVLA